MLAYFGSVWAQGCDRQMIFDMLKRLRSVVYLPNDYVCKKVMRCLGSWPGVQGTRESQDTSQGVVLEEKHPQLQLILYKD